MRNRVINFLLIFLYILPAHSMLKKHGELSCVYWGSFDPPTLAHKAIISYALHEIPLKKLMVIVNNDQRKKYRYSLEKRCCMLRKMFKGEKNLEILTQNEQDSLNYFKLKAERGGALCAIAGYDSYKKWVISSEKEKRSLYDYIAVVPRGKEEPVLKDGNAFILPISPHYHDISSTLVKNSLREGKDISSLVDKDVLDLIKEIELKN